METFFFDEAGNHFADWGSTGLEIRRSGLEAIRGREGSPFALHYDCTLHISEKLIHFLSEVFGLKLIGKSNWNTLLDNGESVTFVALHAAYIKRN